MFLVPSKSWQQIKVNKGEEVDPHRRNLLPSPGTKVLLPLIVGKVWRMWLLPKVIPPPPSPLWDLPGTRHPRRTEGTVSSSLTTVVDRLREVHKTLTFTWLISITTFIWMNNLSDVLNPDLKSLSIRLRRLLRLQGSGTVPPLIQRESSKSFYPRRREVEVFLFLLLTLVAP